MGDVRYTRGKYAWDLNLRHVVVSMLWRLPTWGLRRMKPIAYHPIAILGIAFTIALCAVSPWLVVALLLAVPAYAREWPDSYLRHVHPRIISFFAGFRYRHRPRKKLKPMGLLADDEPIATVSHVRKIGCTTKVRTKMQYGDDVDWWREKSSRLAQTYNALDCKVNPYRRHDFTSLRVDEFLKRPPYVKLKFTKKVTKPRWLEMEFLTKDPFSSNLGVEFINYHAAETLSPVVATYRTGETQGDDLAAHRLRIAMTRWGKSNANRATIYAQRANLASGILEIWLIDGKGGVEGAFLEHQVARHAYGDIEADPDAYDPAEFDQLLKDAVTVMKRRQRKMRGFVDQHIPTPAEPWLRIMIDEILVLTSKNVPPEIRNSIAANTNLIMQQGIGCGVSIDASTQLGTKDKLDPIDRSLFTAFEIGKVERGVVDMIFGTGWWERGARADEIAEDLKGTFYRKTETTMAPQEIRYPRVTIADLRTMLPARESVLWAQPDREKEFGFA